MRAGWGRRASQLPANANRTRFGLSASTMLALGLSLSLNPPNPVSAREEVQAISVAAGSLTTALNRLAAQTGIQIVFDAALANGKTSAGAHGELTPAQALSAVLAGTGLTARFTGDDSVTITARAAPAAPVSDAPTGAIQLDPIEVQGETAWGPVTGYVAHQSATATKTNTAIIETPQTISVITRQQIEDQQAQSIRSALSYAPGVYTSDDADIRFEPVYARGCALDQYLDGLKLLAGTWSVPRVDPYFLERAEVLEGPASVLYGQASPGGLLNMVSKRPPEAPHHEIELQTGSYGRLQGAFDIGGPVDPGGQVLYRVTGLARDTGTQVDYVREQRLAIAPSITFRPDTNTSLTILTSYLRDPKAGFWNLLPYQGTLLPGAYGQIPRDFYVGDPSFENFSFNQAMAGYQFEHRFSDVWTIRQNFRYTHISLAYEEVQGSTLRADG